MLPEFDAKLCYFVTNIQKNLEFLLFLQIDQPPCYHTKYISLVKKMIKMKSAHPNNERHLSVLYIYYLLNPPVITKRSLTRCTSKPKGNIYTYRESFPQILFISIGTALKPRSTETTSGSLPGPVPCLW